MPLFTNSRAEPKMARVSVSIVHDELGRILSINRPAQDAKNVVVLTGDGQSVFVTEVEEEDVHGLFNSHRVDYHRKALVKK
jgi:hypothetical protein